MTCARSSGCASFVWAAVPAAGLSRQEAKYGFHAGEVETALLLAATPELVHTDEYTVNYIADVDAPGMLKPEGGYATFAWLTRDIAPSGVMGDPRPGHRRQRRKVDCVQMSTRTSPPPCAKCRSTVTRWMNRFLAMR